MIKILTILSIVFFPFVSKSQIQAYIEELKDSKKEISNNSSDLIQTKKGWVLYAEYCPSGDSITLLYPPLKKDTQTYYFFDSNKFLIEGQYGNSYKINGTYHLRNDSIIIRYDSIDIYPSSDTVCDYRIIKLDSKRLIVDYIYDYKKIWGNVEWNLCPISRFLFIKKE